MQTHAMETIATQGQTQVAKAEALKTGRYNKAAASIWGAFGKGTDNHRTRTIYSLIQEGFTFAEYDQIERMALEMAKEADKAGGWKPKDGAKGRELYGPKQSAMAQRASERRQVFGVMRQNFTAICGVPASGIVHPDTLPTFDVALVKARKWLRDSQLSWDGQGRKALPVRAQALLQNSTQDATAEAMAENPKEPDEPMTDYLQRLAPVIAEKAEASVEKTQEQQAGDIAKKLVKDHGLPMCLKIADAILKLASEPEAASDEEVKPETDTAPANVGETAPADGSAETNVNQ
jgi:hypothetical protein